MYSNGVLKNTVHRGGPSSVIGHSMWHLWMTSCHWAKIFYQSFGILLTVLPDWRCIFIHSTPTLYVMLPDVLAKFQESDQQIFWTKKKILYSIPLRSYALGSCSTGLKTSLQVSLIIALQFEGYCNTCAEFSQSDGSHVATCYSI